MIISGLELTPGKLVAESGTGSTSLSHAIIRSIAPTGHLNTFEFNDYRVEYAKKDFTNNLGSFKDNVTVFHRDVLKEGFKSDNIVEYDAIFLDLPAPWNAIVHVYEVLKTGGRVCSFSPCIEQSQYVCRMLNHYNFYNIETIECIPREFRQNDICYPTPNCLLEDQQDPKKEAKTGKTSIKGKGSRPFTDIPGHTGFLTFATKV